MKLIIPLFITLLSFSSCNKDGCSNNKHCTEEFRSIVVEINYPTSFPFIDYLKVYKKSDNTIINEYSNSSISSHVLFDDSNLTETSKKGEIFILEGYENNNKIFLEEYVIKHDCCHVIKVSGKDTINL